MIEFFKLKDNPNTIVMREKGARGPTKETHIIVPLEARFLAEAKRILKRKKSRRK